MYKFFGRKHDAQEMRQVEASNSELHALLNHVKEHRLNSLSAEKKNITRGTKELIGSGRL